MNKTGLPVEVDAGRAKSRTLHYAPPDFLWNLVASVYFMRLSSRKGARAVLSSAAWQEIRVRSGRDDKFLAAERLNCRSLGFAPDEQTAPGCSAALNLQSRRDDLNVAQDVSPG